MDFIDPNSHRRTRIQLFIGYILIACAIVMTTLVLLYQAYGYSLGKNGQLIQHGLIFMSSSPNPASIYLNGTKTTYQTNQRLNIAAGQYTVRLERAGYRSWQRAIGVEGGSVEHFDYPFLIPQKLQTTTQASYASQPALTLQSPDRRWLLMEQPSDSTSFDEYDLSNPKQVATSTVTIPSGLLTQKDPQNLQLVDWSTDNIHALLQHNYDGGSEYILLDRQTPSNSLNLTRTLGLNATTQVLFNNNHYDQYFLFDTAAQTLSTATLSDSKPTVVVSHVLAYKAYGNNTFLYTTPTDAAEGRVNVRLLQGTNTYTIRQLAAGATTYVLNLTKYNGDWYMLMGDSSEDKTYVYKNPQNILSSQSNLPLVPVQILKVIDPTYAAFSANAQFAMAENSNSFAIYDAENDKGYTYDVHQTFAADQHVTWMDGDRLMAILGGKVVIWDYDDANEQTLEPGISGTLPYFDQNYKWLYNMAPSSDTDGSTPFDLTKTAMRLPADQ